MVEFFFNNWPGMFMLGLLLLLLVQFSSFLKQETTINAYDVRIILYSYLEKSISGDKFVWDEPQNISYTNILKNIHKIYMPKVHAIWYLLSFFLFFGMWLVAFTIKVPFLTNISLLIYSLFAAYIIMMDSVAVKYSNQIRYRQLLDNLIQTYTIETLKNTIDLVKLDYENYKNEINGLPYIPIIIGIITFFEYAKNIEIVTLILITLILYRINRLYNQTIIYICYTALIHGINEKENAKYNNNPENI